jgi:hypothetical protein
VTTYTYDGVDRLTRLKDAKNNTVIAVLCVWIVRGGGNSSAIIVGDVDCGFIVICA